MELVIMGGSDAGISAVLGAPEVDPAIRSSIVLADQYPNFSICGFPAYHGILYPRTCQIFALNPALRRGAKFAILPFHSRYAIRTYARAVRAG